MNLKKINKRGQDLPIGTLILVVLGVIVLVLIVIGFTKGWDYIFSWFGAAPGKSLETTIQGCNFAGQAGLKADYCLEFKKIDYAGETRYVNCEDSVIKSQLTTPLDGSCDGAQVSSASKIFCYNQISASDWTKVKVNGVTCNSMDIACDGSEAAVKNCAGKIRKNAAGTDCCYTSP